MTDSTLTPTRTVFTAVLSPIDQALYPGMTRAFSRRDASAETFIAAKHFSEERTPVVLQLREDDPTRLYSDIGVLVRHGEPELAADGETTLLLRALMRVRRVDDDPSSSSGRFVELPDEPFDKSDLANLTERVFALFNRRFLAASGESLPTAFASAPAQLSYVIASRLPLSRSQQQELLAMTDIGARLRRIEELLNADTSADVNAGDSALASNRSRIAHLSAPPEVLEAARRALARLERTPEASNEYAQTLDYLEWMLAMPWRQEQAPRVDVDAARSALNRDHNGLGEVKRRIIDYLAVAKLKGTQPGSIICLVGPPGTGKTSIAESIARATNRRFARIALGGVGDEAKIRGYNRSYQQAQPGAPARALRECGSATPVILLDEIDKLDRGHGDPASALLELLDPSQNAHFRDHYLDLPLDFSNVLFVCTANYLDDIPEALRDRLELIEIPGYSEVEKFKIARSHLLPRQLEQNGIKTEQLAISDEALRKLISDYSHESGLRNLERQLAAICRKAAAKLVDGEKAVEIDVDELACWLGPHVRDETDWSTFGPGVAAGLAKTGEGGRIMLVEAIAHDGHGRLQLTGHLGEVMQESAQIAHSWAWANAEQFGVDADWFARHDVHVHVPAGAIAKDGPSAGITIASALISLAAGRPVRTRVAMTGEISLSGRVLGIGGLREKAIAAAREGVELLIIPRVNEPELENIPLDTLAELTVKCVETAAGVIEAVLER